MFLMSPLSRLHYKFFVLNLFMSEVAVLDVLQNIVHVKLTVSFAFMLVTVVFKCY